MSLRLKTQPTIEPISVADTKLFLRIDTSGEDSLIGTLITAARNMAEDYTNSAFCTQTWTLFLDQFPYGRTDKWWDGVVQASKITLNEGTRQIIIPRPPLASITYLKTYDDDDTATTYSSSNYIVDTTGMPGRVILKNGQVWPSALRPAKGVEIEFICGYGAPSAVPAAIKHALYLIVGKLYECRGEDAGMDISMAAKRLMNPYRVHSIGDLNPQRANP